MIFVFDGIRNECLQQCFYHPTFFAGERQGKDVDNASNNPDDPQVTTLTSAQTAQARLWAMACPRNQLLSK
jgi:hypothetical protein